MQYFIKIYNKTKGTLVGYYKEKGITNITKLPKGMKYFNSIEEALIRCNDITDGFVRDKDGHYYRSLAIIYGSDKLEPKRPAEYLLRQMTEEEKANELQVFLRQNNLNEI